MMEWTEILHRRSDGSYVVTLPNGLPYHVPTDHENWAAIDAAAPEELPPEEEPESPPPLTRWKVRKSTLIERMTEDELDRYDETLGALTMRQRHRWQSVTYVWSDDAEVLAFAEAIADEPTEERVAALLALDPPAQALPD